MEARRAEARVIGEVAVPPRREPEPRQPQRGQKQEDHPRERPHQLAAAAVEVELPRAEPGVLHHELLPVRHVDRIVEAERRRAEDVADHEELYEVPHPATEREADATPRRAAETVAPRPD